MEDVENRQMDASEYRDYRKKRAYIQGQINNIANKIQFNDQEAVEIAKYSKHRAKTNLNLCADIAEIYFSNRNPRLLEIPHAVLWQDWLSSYREGQQSKLEHFELLQPLLEGYFRHIKDQIYDYELKRYLQNFYPDILYCFTQMRNLAGPQDPVEE